MKAFTFFYFAKYVGDTIWRQVALTVFTLLVLQWTVKGLEKLVDWWDERPRKKQ